MSNNDPVRCIGCRTLLWTEAPTGTEFKQTTVTPCAKPECNRSYIHGWRTDPPCVVRLIVTVVNEPPMVVDTTVQYGTVSDA